MNDPTAVGVARVLLVMALAVLELEEEAGAPGADGWTERLLDRTQAAAFPGGRLAPVREQYGSLLTEALRAVAAAAGAARTILGRG